jgi:RimJ/RimL family protein N-acetyltransferase
MAGKLMANQDKMVAEWVVARLPLLELKSSPYTALGWLTPAGIVAGVVYQNYTKTDIHMHAAGIGKRWLTKHFLGECFRYPFEQLQCRRVTAMVPGRNEAAIAFDEHLGFVLEGVVRQILPNGDDLRVYGMLREECRYLNIGRSRGYEHRISQFRAQAG